MNWLANDHGSCLTEWTLTLPGCSIHLQTGLHHQPHVMNDCAEQSVKDVTEFINYAKDPARLDRVMMVVKHHRQILDLDNQCSHLTWVLVFNPTQRLKPGFWYLTEV